MASIVIAGDTSGTVTLAAPATAGTTTLTLPTTDGTVLTTTGGVAPGTAGNLLTSDGTAWTSAAAPAGGVTSLNGQTGAITNNTYDAISSFAGAFGASLTTYTVGSTTAGSNLRKLNTGGSFANAGLTGTWRFMGPKENSGEGVWVRIS
jgi:hypothetical protein